MKATVKKIASQPSWLLRGSDVELAVTQLGDDSQGLAGPDAAAELIRADGRRWVELCE